MICETKLTIYGYFFVGRNSLQQPKQRLWDSITPRLRGEKLFIPVSIRPSIGSPPLARGKVLLLSCDSVRNGITPACAGKRGFGGGCCFSFRDHPRLRGEKLGQWCSKRDYWGSPPLARGKDNAFKANAGTEGITPACAGKSTQAAVNLLVGEDHPRLRGEKVTLDTKRILLCGITPACAGKRR